MNKLRTYLRVFLRIYLLKEVVYLYNVAFYAMFRNSRATQHLLLNHEEIFTLENVFDQCQIDSPNLVPD